MGLMPPIFFLALGLFGVYCIEFGVVGILPLIIARYGISTAQAGWLVGIFALTIALLGPLLVLLASRFNRKRMLLIALTVFAAASALSAQVDSFAMLMLLRHCAGVVSSDLFFTGHGGGRGALSAASGHQSNRLCVHRHQHGHGAGDTVDAMDRRTVQL